MCFSIVGGQRDPLKKTTTRGEQHGAMHTYRDTRLERDNRMGTSGRGCCRAQEWLKVSTDGYNRVTLKRLE